MPPFDLEQGKLSVRVSEGVYYQFLADIEEFKFTKSDGSENANAFFNQLIPNLIAYRIEKRKDLRKFFENNIVHCIKESYQDKLLYYMDDLFNYSYFDDYREHYHNYMFHFRLNKSNIINLQDFFDELAAQNQNKTTYLRNLFNEYANMRKDKREAICFDNEYSTVRRAISENLSINCYYNGENYSLIPYKVDLNYADGSLYLLSIEVGKPNLCHAFKVCWLRNVSLKETYFYQFSDKTKKKLDYLIYEYDYTDKPNIFLSRLKK